MRAASENGHANCRAEHYWPSGVEHLYAKDNGQDLESRAPASTMRRETRRPIRARPFGPRGIQDSPTGSWPLAPTWTVGSPRYYSLALAGAGGVADCHTVNLPS